MKENILRRRLKNTLYEIYDEHLDRKTLSIFHEVRENDPYLNQVVEDVLDYVVNDLPLENYLVEKLRGERLC